MSVVRALKFNLTQSPQYLELFSSGTVGGMNPSKCSMVFFVDKPQLEMNPNEPGKVNIKEINRELLAEVIVTPVQFKQIAEWMMRNIQAYEKQFGKITPQPKQDDDDKPQTFIS